MKRGKGIFICGDDVRLSKERFKTMQELAALNDDVLKPIRNREDLVEASFRILPSEILDEVSEIMERLIRKDEIERITNVEVTEEAEET